jgi:Fic family protein
MNYERIQPFPPLDAHEFSELRALTSVWQERKDALEDDGAYKEFIKKLQREWAIETGIIERLYTWDRGVTEVLIEQGIESSLISHRGGVSQRDADHIQALINDHLGIVEGLFGYIKGEEPLSEYFIRGLQAQFTAHQDYTEAVTESGDLIKVPLLKGEYKTLPNNPRRPDGEVHAYCPPELTKEEMESLIRLYREADASYTPEVKSAWLHHRFTQIHPFRPPSEGSHSEGAWSGTTSPAEQVRGPDHQFRSGASEDQVQQGDPEGLCRLSVCRESLRRG